MKILRAACAVLIGATILFGGSASFAETITKDATGISRVEFKLPGELVVRQGTQEKLIVEAETKILPKLQMDAKGDLLVLNSKETFKTDKPLKFTLTIKSLRGIRSAGSGNVLVEGFAGGAVDIHSFGSGNVKLRGMKPNSLVIKIEGSGAVEASGGADSLAALISGSGKIDAVNFRAKSVDAEISGSGDVRVHADEKLNAKISGAGNVEYRGNPKVTQSISGAGSVDRL